MATLMRGVTAPGEEQQGLVKFTRQRSTMHNVDLVRLPPGWAHMKREKSRMRRGCCHLARSGYFPFLFKTESRRLFQIGTSSRGPTVSLAPQCGHGYSHQTYKGPCQGCAVPHHRRSYLLFTPHADRTWQVGAHTPLPTPGPYRCRTLPNTRAYNTQHTSIAPLQCPTAEPKAPRKVLLVLHWPNVAPGQPVIIAE